MKYRIGVMGSASGPTLRSQIAVKKAIETGIFIAENNCILVNGACPGLPDEAAFGAKHAGGLTMGISPAFSEKEHTELYKSPNENYDIIIYTGMGLMERDIINIRSSDAIILLGGGVGTLNEFTVAYDEGKVIGVLTETGGVADNIPLILEICGRKMENYIIFESDPRKLVEKILATLSSREGPMTEDERVTKALEEELMAVKAI